MSEKQKYYRQLLSEFLVNEGIKEAFDNALIWRGSFTSDFDTYIDMLERTGTSPHLYIAGAFNWGSGDELNIWISANRKWNQLLKTVNEHVS